MARTTTRLPGLPRRHCPRFPCRVYREGTEDGYRAATTAATRTARQPGTPPATGRATPLAMTPASRPAQPRRPEQVSGHDPAPDPRPASASWPVAVVVVLASPTRTCPRCKGKRVTRNRLTKRRIGCPRCQGTGRHYRRGAVLLHRLRWSITRRPVSNRPASGSGELTMPTYTNPKWVHVEPRSGFPILPLVVLGIIGYAAFKVAEWIASIAVAIEITIAGVAVAAPAGLVLVLRRRRGHVIKPGSVVLTNERAAIAAPAQHLHIHGVSAVELAAILAKDTQRHSGDSACDQRKRVDQLKHQIQRKNRTCKPMFREDAQCQGPKHQRRPRSIFSAHDRADGRGSRAARTHAQLAYPARCPRVPSGARPRRSPGGPMTNAEPCVVCDVPTDSGVIFAGVAEDVAGMLVLAGVEAMEASDILLSAGVRRGEYAKRLAYMCAVCGRAAGLEPVLTIPGMTIPCTSRAIRWRRHERRDAAGRGVHLRPLRRRSAENHDRR